MHVSRYAITKGCRKKFVVFSKLSICSTTTGPNQICNGSFFPPILLLFIDVLFFFETFMVFEIISVIGSWSDSMSGEQKLQQYFAYFAQKRAIL